MDKNNFEKQVQQKMNELKMQPSDAAWKNIEERIKERKPSGRWLLLLLLFAGLGGGGYWVWNSLNGKNSKAVAGKNVHEEKNIIDTNKTERSNYPSLRTKLHDETFSDLKGNSTIKSNQRAIAFSPTPAHYSRRRRPYHSASRERVIAEISPSSTITANVNKDEKVFRRRIESAHVKSIYRDGTNFMMYGIADLVKISKPAPAAAYVPLSDSFFCLTYVRPRWRFGITLTPGISGVGSNFLELNTVEPASYYNLVGQSVGSPGTVTPASMKASLGIVAGAFAEKQFGKNYRWTFQTGLNLILFNTSNKVLKDSLGISNILSGSPKNYQNHFDFISLPVSIKFQLNKSKSVPVFLQGGASLSQMLYANALQLNYSSGYYYHDNSPLNKTQVCLNAGAAIELFSRKKIPVLIGPYLSYGLSPIGKSGLYQDAHFTFAGLNVSVTLKK